MSSLYGLARKASEYVRSRASRAVRDADRASERRATSSYVAGRRSLFDSLRRFIFGRPAGEPPGDEPTRPGPPPIVPGARRGGPPGTQPPRGGQRGITPPLPPPPRPPIGGTDDGDDGFDDVQLLGRDAGYDVADFEAVMDSLRKTPGSSNVYGYYFERESRRVGILYVTFKAEVDGERPNAPGQTYAYYDVPVRKHHEFQQAAASSAGGAVWDYLRIRGTVWGHQHQYRLVQSHGDYVPRKATPRGYRTRNLPALGVGRREYRRSTLPERLFYPPNRGGPNRGDPNRGDPDRGV